MNVKPILFSGPMIRALLEGCKTQTRRILKLNGHRAISDFGPSDTPGYVWHFRDAEKRWHDFRVGDLSARLSYQKGDLLWVRETLTRSGGVVQYTADHKTSSHIWPWEHTSQDPRPSIHMPRWASRITLEVTGVKVDRLWSVSEEDALAEGAWHWAQTADNAQVMDNAREAFCHLWDSINEARGLGWDANPWVVAVSFRVHPMNIDEFIALINATAGAA